MSQKEIEEDFNAHILIVEDDPNHCELIKEAIKDANGSNRVMAIGNGSEALQFLQREGGYMDEEKFPMPDLIILDIGLPGMSGKDLLREIKANERLQSVPVVMLTSSARYEDIHECYMMGANSYVTKPICHGDMVKIIRAIPSYWMRVNKLPCVPKLSKILANK
jgi:CheY-like chemotaxis protein